MIADYKKDYESALETINKAQIEANVIANKVLAEMPKIEFDVRPNSLYTDSVIYTDLCEILTIIKDDEGVFCVTEYDEYIEVHELDDNQYNDVILYIINHLPNYLSKLENED